MSKEPMSEDEMTADQPQSKQRSPKSAGRLLLQVAQGALARLIGDFIARLFP